MGKAFCIWQHIVESNSMNGVDLRYLSDVNRNV